MTTAHPGQRVEAETLQRFAGERLAPHKRPREVRFVAELPRTGSGKIDRRVLRDNAADGAPGGP